MYNDINSLKKSLRKKIIMLESLSWSQEEVKTKTKFFERGKENCKK